MLHDNGLKNTFRKNPENSEAQHYWHNSDTHPDARSLLIY